jgi:ABC-type sulfate transport system substrate-binding protein
MKAKDFLKKVAEQGKINNEDFNKVVETFPEVELGEVFPNLFQESFLTRERAEADPKISQKIKAETLNAVDAKIAKLLPLVDVKDREEIEKEPSSYKSKR